MDLFYIKLFYINIQKLVAVIHFPVVKENFSCETHSKILFVRALEERLMFCTWLRVSCETHSHSPGKYQLLSF